MQQIVVRAISWLIFGHLWHLYVGQHTLLDLDLRCGPIIIQL